MKSFQQAFGPSSNGPEAFAGPSAVDFEFESYRMAGEIGNLFCANSLSIIQIGIVNK